MYAVSQKRLDVVRTGGGQWYGYVQAWLAGSRVTMPDGSTTLPLSSDGTNQVVVDGTKPGQRRTLTVTCPGSDDLFDTLSQPGLELHAWTAVRYLDGSVDVEPQGWFDVDVTSMGYAANGTIQITAPDRWARVKNARFTSPRASTAGETVAQQITTLLTEVLPAGTAVSDTSTSTATVPSQTWDQNRDQAIQDLAVAASLDVYFDRNGGPVIRDVPVLNPTGAVFTIDASTTGVLISADRQRDRQKTYNVVVCHAQTTDGSVPFAPQVAWDNESASATYAGPGNGFGALTDLPSGSQAGPFGQRPTFYSSPLITTAAQAQAAATTILKRVTGLNAQLSLTSVPAPFLDDGDTILVKLVPDLPWEAQPVEVHLIDGFTVPLVQHKNPMPITTRSTRPDDVQEG